MEITQDHIIDAHVRIRLLINKTPVFTSNTINNLSGAKVFFKCENFQKIGAFKIRGGLNAVLSLPETKRKKGIATHSSGNHAQAIAYAAREVRTKAFIVMPNNSPQVKVDAVRGYGAEIFFCEPTQQAREKLLNEVVEKTGAEFIHPYNNYTVIIGQATCAKELIEELPSLDFIIAPVGGGGLLSGTLLSAHYFSPTTVVYAGEPEGAADAVLSIRNNRIEKAPYVKTIADGLLTTLGDKTFPIIKRYVKDILTVSDEDIVAAMRLVYERMKLVVEPSAVVPLAALIKNKDLFRRKRVGVILSGGNVELSKLSGWFKK
ncbi:MAG TPA: pyridoxal-phosphate dependent enzyme [Chitinophagaceae bacterium]|nr:pyridoxal-phosphate dependent enzyme [Chitinophagaceae bacterium]